MHIGELEDDISSSEDFDNIDTHYYLTVQGKSKAAYLKSERQKYEESIKVIQEQEIIEGDYDEQL